MNQYKTLDRLIVLAIEAKKRPLYDSKALDEARKFAESRNIEAFRIVDRRLQAMRKAGLIKHFTKCMNPGWAVFSPELRTALFS